MNTIKITIFTLAALVSLCQPSASKAESCAEYAQELVCSKDITNLSSKDYDSMALDLINKYDQETIKSCHANIKANESRQTPACRQALLRTFDTATKKIDDGNNQARKNRLKHYRARPR
jgi:hypothetical protein